MAASMTGQPASTALCYSAPEPAAEALTRGHHALGAGDFADAIATLQSALDTSTPGDPALQPLHTALGGIFAAQGDLAEASAHYEAALNLTPWSTSALCDLANIFFKLRRFDEAATLYRAALYVEPTHWSARINLALTLRSSHRLGECKSLLLELAAEHPNNGLVYNQLGKVHALGQDFKTALVFFQKAAALNPLDSDSLFWIGGVRQAMGDVDAAKADYARAAKVQPLFKQPARQSPPAFSVLLLCAPSAGNTPVTYITAQSAYETQLLLLLPDVSYDAAPLRRSGQILFNLVSDADQAGGLLNSASDLVDSIGLPVINHPRKVQQTARDIVAGRLQSIEGCRVLGRFASQQARARRRRRFNPRLLCLFRFSRGQPAPMAAMHLRKSKTGLPYRLSSNATPEPIATSSNTSIMHRQTAISENIASFS